MDSSRLFSENGREKIGFVGVGRSTLGVYRYLYGRGFRRFLFRSEKKTALPAGVEAGLVCGEGWLSDIREDVLFLSPSVRSDRKEIAEAKKRGCRITSDCDLFFREAAGTVFAVTGSDGKSTTTTMLYELLKSGGNDARLIGNIGVPMTPCLVDDGADVLYAAELSSFQLNDEKPRSKRAVITTISPNHLDFHGGFREYAEAKSHIYGNTEEPVLNADCPHCSELLGRKPFAVFSLFKSEKELLATGAGICVYRKDGDVYRNGTKLFSLSDLQVKGLYNAANLACAAAMADGFCDPDAVLSLAKTFRGIPHRAETVGEVGGVRYVDSSIDSSPARTVTTLSSFCERPVVILGGRGKGVPFDSLVPVLAQKAKGVVVMGETGEEIYRLLSASETFKSSGAFLRKAEKMGDAVSICAELSVPGDVVLLSPASTSFDAYRNFEERGEDFRHEVNMLTQRI